LQPDHRLIVDRRFGVRARPTELPKVAGRTCTQPSRKIELSQFDIANPATSALPMN
jgi:hypothetical protein